MQHIPSIPSIHERDTMVTEHAFETLKAKVKSDQTLLGKLSGLKEVDDVVNALVDIAKMNGIAITAEEIKVQITSSLHVETGKALGDDVLELVSGGAGSPYCFLTEGCYCMCTGTFTQNWF